MRKSVRCMATSCKLLCGSWHGPGYTGQAHAPPCDPMRPRAGPCDSCMQLVNTVLTLDVELLHAQRQHARDRFAAEHVEAVAACGGECARRRGASGSAKSGGLMAASSPQDLRQQRQRRVRMVLHPRRPRSPDSATRSNLPKLSTTATVSWRGQAHSTLPIAAGGLAGRSRVAEQAAVRARAARRAGRAFGLRGVSQARSGVYGL